MNCPLNISFLSNDLWKVYLRWEGQMMLWEKSYTEFISPLHVSSGKLPWSCRPGEKRTVWSEKSPLPSCECLHFGFFFFVSLYLLPIQMPMLFIYFSSTFIGCFFFFPLCIQMAVCFCNVLLGFRDPRAWLTKGCVGRQK